MIATEQATRADYFADYSAVSQSMLKVFADRRRLYEAYYVTRTAEPPPATDPMRKGTAVHTALLEPERFNELVMAWPEGLLSDDGGVRSKAAKAFREEADASGRIVLKPKEFAQVQAMAASVRKAFAPWLELPSRREQCIYWTNPATGLPCKARPDWVIEANGTAFIFDLKTTADASPDAFRLACERNAYWLQDPQYQEGVNITTGLDTEFHFVVVESTFNYACSVQRIAPRLRGECERQRARHLGNLADCLASGDWSDAWEQRISEIDIRPWVLDPNYER